jgi:type II restriction/modification system DNA methylase subunit YeeA
MGIIVLQLFWWIPDPCIVRITKPGLLTILSWRLRFFAQIWKSNRDDISKFSGHYIILLYFDSQKQAYGYLNPDKNGGKGTGSV